MAKAIVLLSSGLDSTVNLYLAHRQMMVERVLTFDYGQRAAPREIERSQEICRRMGLRHEVVALPWLAAISKSSLNDRAQAVPVGGDVSLDDIAQSEKTAKSVWVPNRNGVFLNIAAAYAEALGCEFVIPGFNREEAVTFADNSVEYMVALDNSFALSTRSGVEVACFTANLDKTQIVQRGRELDVPFDLMWPCYFAGETLCGECESCQRFKRAVTA